MSHPFSIVLDHDEFLSLSGSRITCRASDGYVNLTELCRAGKRSFKNWNCTQKSKEFIKALAIDVDISSARLITYQAGYGSDQATWGHPRIAINIAQWLSPEFDVKVSKWVHELSVTGKVALRGETDSKELDKLWKERLAELENTIELQRAQIEDQTAQIEGQAAEIKEQSGKIEHFATQIEARNGKIERLTASNHRLAVNHESLKKSRSRYQFKKGKAFYVVSHDVLQGDYYKPGYSANLTSRVSQYNTAMPEDYNMEYLVYCEEAKLIEQNIQLAFRDRKDPSNKEWLKGVSLEEIKAKVRAFLDQNKISHTEEDIHAPDPEDDDIDEIDLSTLDIDEKEFTKLKPYQRVPPEFKDTHKKCTICLYLKPKNLFDSCITRSDALTSCCKPCLRVKREQHKKEVKANLLDVESKRTCSECLQEKQVKDFNRHNAYKDGYYPICKICLTIRLDANLQENLKDPGTHKTCGRCKKNVPIEEYNKSARRPDGLNKYCKVCSRQRAKEAIANIVRVPEPKEKVCKKCKENKPITVFWNLKASKDGRNDRCAECIKNKA